MNFKLSHRRGDYLLLVYLLIVCVVVFFNRNPVDNLGMFRVDRSDSSNVARAFADAMEGRDSAYAKLVARPELRARIDDWTAKKHDTAAMGECVTGGIGGLAEDDQWWDFSTFCEGGKSFKIDNIRVNHFGSEWWVTGWDSVCEPYVDGSDCENAK